MHKKSAALTIILSILFVGSLVILFSPFLKATWLEYTLKPQRTGNTTSTQPRSTLPSLQPTPTTSPAAFISSSTNTYANVTYSGSVLAGQSTPLFRFTKSNFDRAIDNNALIVLYFYSDSDENSKDELPEIIDAFNQLSTDQVVGFVVHLNDDSVTEEELAIAQAMRVSTPNTKVFVKNNQSLFHISDSWDQQAYLSQITQTLTSL